MLRRSRHSTTQRLEAVYAAGTRPEGYIILLSSFLLPLHIDNIHIYILHRYNTRCKSVPLSGPTTIVPGETFVLVRFSTALDDDERVGVA